MEQKPLIAIVGPTASGKTTLAVELCRKIGGEVVTADSMQVYRGMDIGTAKPDSAEQCGIPHHMIDVADPDEDYSVHRYREQAEACIAAIHSRGRIPVLSGGTGLYVNAVVYAMRFTDAGTDEAYRQELKELSRREGVGSLHQKLRQVDPVSADKIHPNNMKRVIRALEVHRLTGIPISRYADSGTIRWYPYACFGLSMPRAMLYERIDRRVDLMIEQGLLSEVERLYHGCPGWSQTARQALGYKEFIDYLEGRTSLDEAAELLKKRTRNYAKRQLTWFSRMKDTQWMGPEMGTMKQIIDFIEKKLIEKSFAFM